MEGDCKAAIITYSPYKWLIKHVRHFYYKNWKNPYPLDICMTRKENWSEDVKEYIENTKENKILIIMGDYIIRRVKEETIKWAEQNLKTRVKLSRFDRHAKHINNDIYPPNKPYSIDLQISLWNKDFLLETLKPRETPWKFETQGSKRNTEDILWREAFYYTPTGAMCKGDKVKQEIQWMKENW